MIKEKILFDFSVRFNIKANKTFIKISGTHATSWRKRFNFHTFENKYISFLTVYSICTFIDLNVPTMLICLSHVQHMMSKPYLDQHSSIQKIKISFLKYSIVMVLLFDDVLTFQSEIFSKNGFNHVVLLQSLWTNEATSFTEFRWRCMWQVIVYKLDWIETLVKWKY